MKKGLLPLFSFMLVLGLLLTSFSSAKAEIGDDPVVTPVSGDMEFSTEVVPIASLPGTTLLPDEMLVPVGFPLGEAQFEGAGVLVTNFDSGKATACFAISGVQFGWGGKVGVWNGTKWVLLSTTITTAEEALNSVACAPISGSGTYAFIRYVVDPSMLNQCRLDTSGWSLGVDNEGYPYYYVNVNNLPYGTPVSFVHVSADPSVNYLGPVSGSGYSGNNYPFDADFFGSYFETNGTVLVTLRVTAEGCTRDLQIYVNSESNPEP
jgi:hypothetical protein